MWFKDFFFLAALSLVEQNNLCNFGRGHYKEYFFEIILDLDKWFKRRCHF